MNIEYGMKYSIWATCLIKWSIIMECSKGCFTLVKILHHWFTLVSRCPSMISNTKCMFLFRLNDNIFIIFHQQAKIGKHKQTYRLYNYKWIQIGKYNLPTKPLITSNLRSSIQCSFLKLLDMKTLLIINRWSFFCLHLEQRIFAESKCIKLEWVIFHFYFFLNLPRKANFSGLVCYWLEFTV